MKARLARLPVIGTVLRVLERYRLDAADQFAAAIGLFGFLALVPVFLLAIAGLGFVLADPDEQLRVAEALAETIPGLGATLGGGEGVQGFVETVVERRGALTGIGIVGVFLTALRPVNAAMTATTTVFRAALPQGGPARVRQLAALAVLGIVALSAVGTSTVIGFVALPTVLRVSVSVGATYLLDVLLFLTAYTVLSPGARVHGRALLPGALLAGAGWTLLKVAGSALVSTQIQSANALYGALGGVVALLLLLYLAGRLYLYGAELAAVRYERVHGPIPVPPGATSLARIDDPLPDGTYVTAPSRPRSSAAMAFPAVGLDAPRRAASAAGTTRPSRWDEGRKVAAYAAAIVGVAAAYRVLRELDPS